MVDDLRKKLKSNYTNERIRKCVGKSKSIWTVIKDVAGIDQSSNRTTISKLTQNGCEYTDQDVIAEVLNNFYINIGPMLSDSLADVTFQHISPEVIDNSFTFKNVNEDEVKCIIRGLSNKSTSPNGISNILLKRVIDIASPNITKLINMSYQQGIYPSRCKLTEVIPLFKSGDPTDPGNYRPLSMLSALSRVTEKSTKIRLESYLEEIGFFYKFQYGFKRDKDAHGAVLI